MLISKLSLSSAQLGVWYSILSGTPAELFNVAKYNKIFGKVDSTIFEMALRQVVRETDSVRVNFVQEAEEPSQKILTNFEWPFVFEDLSSFKDGDSVAQNWMNAEIARPVDPYVGPFFSYALFKITDELFFWYARYHHLVMDAYGDRLITSRTAEIYSAMNSGTKLPESRLGPLEELIAEDKKYRASDRYATDRKYWSEALRACPEPPNLGARGSPGPGRVVRRRATVSSQALETIENLAKKLELTAPQVFTLCAVTLIHRLSGVDDIVLGQFMATRLTPISRRTPGMMANVAPLRLRVHSGMTVVELSQLLRGEVRSAMRHQKYDIAEVRRDLRRLTRPIIGPTININPFENKLQFAGFDSALFGISNGPIDDVCFYITHDTAAPGQWLLEVIANSKMYDDVFLRLMEERFLRLLTLIDGPELRIDQIDVATPAEIEESTVTWNLTQAEYPRDKGAHELFEEKVRVAPSRTAAQFEGEAWSYAELNARANRIAAFLAARGVSAGAYVALSVDRSIDMLAALLGVWKAGAAYIPLDPSYPPERLNFIFRDAKPAMLITHRRHRKIFDVDEALVGYLEDVGESQSDFIQPGKAGLAYVLYTSGSTGAPKGVRVRHRSLVNFLTSMAKEPGITENDRLLAVTSLSFDIAGLELFLPLIVGAEVVIAPSEVAADGRRLRQLFEAVFPTIMQGTPTTWRLLLEAGWRGGGDLKVLCGGEAWPPDLADALLPLCGSLWNMYGPTETTIWSAVTRIDRGRPVVIGGPIANTSFYVLDSHAMPVPIGVPGELHIGGDGVAEGYLGRSDLTNERFVTDPFSKGDDARMYKTGDRVRPLPGRFFEFMGRLDNQIKIRGYRVELGEIEQALRAHPNVSDAVVVAVDQNERERRLVGYVTTQGAALPSAGELREFVKTKLPTYMVPNKIASLASFPLTPNLKIDRKALAALPLETSETEYCDAKSDAPGTPLEELLIGLWREALRMDKIGIHDDFFEIGGDFLSMVRLSMEIERVVNVPFPLNRIHEAPTIAKMAEVLGGRGSASAYSPLVMLREGGGAKPIFMIHAIGGSTIQLMPIAKALPGDQPVYGIEARGFDGKDEPIDRVETMAKLYADAIVEAQPQGPYYIVGMCFGGLVAIEMARLLTRRGASVAFLGLLDAYPHPKYWPKRFWFNYFVLRRARELIGTVSKLPPREAGKYVAEQARKVISKFRNIARSQRDPFIRPARPLPPSIQAVLDKGNIALVRYQPRYYSGEAKYLMCGYHEYIPEGPAVVWGRLFGRLQVDTAPVLATAEQIAAWIFQKAGDSTR